MRKILHDYLDRFKKDAKMNIEFLEIIDSIIQKNRDQFTIPNFTEDEKRIIEILLSLNFFSNPSIEIIDKMMAAIREMNVARCLEQLIRYTKIVEISLKDEIEKRRRNHDTDYFPLFEIGAIVGQFTTIFSELSEILSQLKEEYEQMRQSFLAQYSIDAIVSRHDFSSFTEFRDTFKTRIQETAKNFSDNKQKFVLFVEGQIKSLTAFQLTVNYQYYYDCCGDANMDTERNFYDALPPPPAPELKRSLEETLRMINQIEV